MQLEPGKRSPIWPTGPGIFLHRTDAGFTLIELLVVLLLMLVLSVIAVPEIIKTLYRSQLDSGTRAVQLVAARARQGAVLHQSRVMVLTGQTTPAGANETPELYLVAIAPDNVATPLQLELRHLANVDLEGPPASPAASVGLVPIDTSTWPAVESPHGTLTLSADGMVFLPDGSVEQVGAWRLAHQNEKTFTLTDGSTRVERFDYRELRLQIRATGRLVLNRWNRETETFERAKPVIN